MPTNSYDLIVLGDDFSGLVAATLCARRGLRVLVATMDRAASSYRLGPYRLPVEPLPLVGLGGPAIRRVLDELQLLPLVKRKLRAEQPAFQMVGPDVRISVDPDDSVLARELEREWPLAATAGGAAPGAAMMVACERAGRIAALLDPVFSMDVALPPTGFWERREIGRIGDRLEAEATAWDRGLEGDLARAFFALPAAFCAGADPADLDAVSRARAFAGWRQGVARVLGDWESLRAMFVDKLEALGGEVRAAAPQSLSSSWGKVTGLVLAGGEELGAGHLLAALPVADLAPLCERKIAKRLAEAADGMEVGAYRYTLNVVLDAIGVPEGIGSHVLLVADPSLPLVDDNALALSVDPPDSEARVAIAVQAICPAPPGGSGSAGAAELGDMLATLRGRVRRRLEEIMPFHADQVRVAHSPHESALPDGLDDLERTKVMRPRPLWRRAREAALGVTGLPYQTGVKQLLLGSSQILPGLGIEGEFAAGWCAAKLVCEGSGKKKDQSKDEAVTAGRG